MAEVLVDNGIEATVEPSGDAFDVLVTEAQLAAAKELFADPFAEEGDTTESEPALEVPALEPGDRTETLARSPDFLAAQRLAELLHSAGLYASVDSTGLTNTFGVDGAPEATVSIASKQRVEAFATLEAFAREHTEAFAGAQNIDPTEVVEALLAAPAGVVVVRTKK